MIGLNDLQDWDQIKLLSVQINRLRRWHRPGLLCIGDAAHAMSPAGGVGINLAIQDAVAAANLLARPLLERRVTEALLAQVQQRRIFPTRVTQHFQVHAHQAMQYVFQNTGPLKAPWQLKLALRVPGLQATLGRAIGVGVRPEHISGRKSRSIFDSFSAKRLAVFAGLITSVAVAAVQIARSIRKQRHSGLA